MREIRLEINQFWGDFFLNLDFEMQNRIETTTRLDVWRCVMFLGLDILYVS